MPKCRLKKSKRSVTSQRQLRSWFISILGTGAVCAIAASGASQSIDLPVQNVSEGWKFNAPNSHAILGWAVAALGDVNGDGFDDISASAPFADYAGSYAGAVYVIFGSANQTSASLDLRGLDGTNGFRIDGESGIGNGAVGWDAAPAGDTNGDGFDDILLGSRVNANGSYSGAAYLVFGKANFDATLPLNGLQEGQGVRFAGAQSELASSSVHTAGDFNGDDLADIIVSSHNRPPGGGAYIIYGRQDVSPRNVVLSDLSSTEALRLNGASGEIAGRNVSPAGDFNGDGIDDVVIGNRDANSLAGGAYIVFGKANRQESTLSMADMTASEGMIIDVTFPDFFRFSWAVSGGGDVNGDGFSDVTISTPYSYGDTARPTAYIIFGRAAGPSTLQLPTANPSQAVGFCSCSEPGSMFGQSISNEGDFNQDGYADVLVGIKNGQSSGAVKGSALVIYGKPGWSETLTDIDALSSDDAVRINGETTGTELGYDVTLSGDFNNDGVSDALLGAPRTEASGANTGTAYVVYGTRFVNVKKMKVALNFAAPDSDSLSVKGSLPVTTGFTPAGRHVSLNVGGTTWTVQLDAKGQASIDGGLIKLGAEKKGLSALSASFKRNAFQSDFADDGLTDGNFSKAQRHIPVTVYLDGKKHIRFVPQLYTAKQGKSGKTK